MEAVNIKTNGRCAIKVFEYNTRDDLSYNYAIEKARRAYKANKLGTSGIITTFVCETIEVENNFSLKHKFAVIMELFEQNLADLIVEMQERELLFTESQILKFAMDLSQTLAAAHSQGFYHLNIKDENIFPTEDRLSLKIGDFDLPNHEARQINEKNAMFFPPELSTSDLVQTIVQWAKVDAYGVGIVMLKLALLRVEITRQEAIDVGSLLEEVTSAYGKRLSVFIERMILDDPVERWSAEKLFKTLQENCMVDGVTSEEMGRILSTEQNAVRDLIEKGLRLRKSEDHRGALRDFDNARAKVDAFVEINQYDRVLIVNILHNTALCYYDLKDYPSALRQHFHCLDLKKKYLAAIDISTSLGSIAKVYIKLGDPQKGLIYYIKAYYAAKHSDNGIGGRQMNIAKALDNIAGVYEVLGDYTNAIQCHFQCLEIIKKQFGDQNSRYGKSLRNISRIFRSMNKLQESKVFEQMAKKINY